MLLLEQLGNRLKMIRTAAGIKQKDLAEKLDIPAPLLSMYEKGAREPSIRFLDTYTKLFNMSLSQLFTFVDEPSSNPKSDVFILMSKMKNLLFDLEKHTISQTQ